MEENVAVERWTTQTRPDLNEPHVRPDHTRISSARSLIHSFIRTRSFRNDTSTVETASFMKPTHSFTFVTVFTKAGSGPHPEADEPRAPSHLVTILPSRSRTNKWPLAFKHPHKFLCLFQFPHTCHVVKLVHRPPYDHCNTPMILSVGTSYEAIHCIIFLLRLKRKAATTTTQCHSGQRMSYLYILHNTS